MRDLFTRSVAVVSGLLLFAAGISSLFLAELGAGPWDVLHDAIAGLLDRQPGTIIAGLGVVIVVGVAALRQPIGPGTLANVVIIGLTVNVILALVEPPSMMVVRLGLVAVAPLVTALGTMFYIGGGLGVGPRDGLMTGLADLGLSLRTARTLLETTVLLLGVVLGGQFGIGTVVFALLVGPALQFFRQHLWMGMPELSGGVWRRS